MYSVVLVGRGGYGGQGHAPIVSFMRLLTMERRVTFSHMHACGCDVNMLTALERRGSSGCMQSACCAELGDNNILG